jgi:hypothetical protein
MIINTDGLLGHGSFMDDISVCAGDSGTGVFLVEPNGIRYDDHPDEFPTTIALKDGLPILVGLMANAGLHGLATDPVEKKNGCGREEGSDAIIATRADFFHDWIFDKAGLPRTVPGVAAPPSPVAPESEAIFPSVVAPKYANEAPGKARYHTCLDQYADNKTSGRNGGLAWVGDGGGYYIECNERLSR